MPWDEIQKWIHSSASQGNDLAKIFVRLNLKDNLIVLRLFDPYEHLDNSDQSDESEDSEDENKKPKNQPKKKQKGMEVELDLDLTAAQNSRQQFTDRKAAAIKQEKTLQSSEIALKNAQKQARNKVKQVGIFKSSIYFLKVLFGNLFVLRNLCENFLLIISYFKIFQVRTNTSIAKARKVMWFEKFYWCISSEGYLIIGGRDAQQNEMVVKRYLRPGDVYVHADLSGASSVVVRNKNKNEEIPPMTLNEAGSMAVCYSNAWEAKVVVSAWWVYHHQVRLILLLLNQRSIG